MVRETLPPINFCALYASGSAARDAPAAAVLSKGTAEIGAGQRCVAIFAEPFAGHGSATAGFAATGSGRGGDAGDRRKAPASGDAVGLRAARIFSAGERGNGAGAGGGRMRSCQPGGAAVLRGAADTRWGRR